MTASTHPLPYVLSWLGRGTLPERAGELHELLERATREGVGGIVATELKRGLPEYPEWLQEKLYGWFRAGAQHLAAMEKLADGLGKHSLIALKGGALLPTIYAGKLSCRPISDVDLLYVDGYDPLVLDAVTSIFAGPVPHVDWHTDLLGSERVAGRAQLLQLSRSEVWELTVPWRGGVRHLSPELQFIHLALHSFKHSCCRLIWLVDQVLVLQNCDAARLLQLAHRVGAERPVIVALHILKRLLGEKLMDCPPLRWWEHIAVRLACRRNHDLSWGELYLALSVHGARHKANYLLQYLLPGSRRSVCSRLRELPSRLWRWLTSRDRNLG